MPAWLDAWWPLIATVSVILVCRSLLAALVSDMAARTADVAEIKRRVKDIQHGLAKALPDLLDQTRPEDPPEYTGPRLDQRT